MLECVCALMCLQARNAAATAPPQGGGGLHNPCVIPTKLRRPRETRRGET